jgi:hypothetical protein
MHATLLTLTLALAYPADPPKDLETPRKPNPLAPSLRELTEEEEKAVDEVIDRFIQYDSGQLKDADGKKVVRDFQQLGPDAIPALIRGLNRAARIDHSCPAVTIARKLAKMLRGSKDTELLEFARENVGAGVERSRHMNVIKDLRVICMLRKNQVINLGLAAEESAPTLLKGTLVPADPWKKSVAKMTISELGEAAGKERGERLKTVLGELGQRKGDMVIAALGSAAATYDGDTQKQARELLDKQLAGLKASEIKEKLKDDRAEVRAAAARVVASKKLPLESALVDLLTDDEKVAWQAAHDALVRLCQGTDLGPRPNASDAERKEAAGKWRTWLQQRGGR